MDKVEQERRERKLRQVVELLQSGNEYTAIQINDAVNTGDARKMISVLRQRGMLITSRIIDKRSGTKAYRLQVNKERKIKKGEMADMFADCFKAMFGF